MEQSGKILEFVLSRDGRVGMSPLKSKISAVESGMKLHLIREHRMHQRSTTAPALFSSSLPYISMIPSTESRDAYITKSAQRVKVSSSGYNRSVSETCPFSRTLDSALDSHGRFEQDKLAAKRQEYARRAQGYQCQYYGQPAQLADKQMEHRKVLLHQMRIKSDSERITRQEKCQEWRIPAASDAKYIAEVKSEKKAHHDYLTKFRDSNQMLRDLRLGHQKSEVAALLQFERSLVGVNPCNWSQTMK